MTAKLEHLEALVAAVPYGVVLFGTDGELLAANPGFCELYEIALAELGAFDLKRYRELLLTSLASGASAASRDAIEKSTRDGGSTVRAVLELARPEKRFIALHAGPALDAESRPMGRFAVHRDVTPEHERLAKAEERADLPDINPIALFRCDSLGRVLFSNAAAERLLLGLGLTPAKAKRLFPRDHAVRIRQALDARGSARAFIHEYKTRSLAFTLSPHPRLPHCMVLVEDVTESRRAEAAIRRYAGELERTNRELRDTQAALVQSEKMASLGSLVAGVAHEIHTPVGSINSNADVMARALEKLRGLRDPRSGAEVKDVSRALDALEDISRVNKAACERIVKIVRSLRNFARLDEAERQVADLHEGLESTLVLVQHELKNRVEVARDYGEDVPRVECVPNQINQVFMNILVNAAQAIPGEGKIMISTRAADGNVRIRIEDTGPGIAPEVLPRIFDPGFTTKGVGVGTGLGLAICYRIVRDHGGEIQASSPPGGGAAFTVCLPVRSPRPVSSSSSD